MAADDASHRAVASVQPVLGLVLDLTRLAVPGSDLVFYLAVAARVGRFVEEDARARELLERTWARTRRAAEARGAQVRELGGHVARGTRDYGSWAGLVLANGTRNYGSWVRDGVVGGMDGVANGTRSYGSWTMNGLLVTDLSSRVKRILEENASALRGLARSASDFPGRLYTGKS